MFSQDLSSNNLDSGAWYLELGWQCLAMLGQKPLTYTTLLTRAPRQGKNVAILGLFLSDWTNRLAGLLDGNGALLVSSRFTFLFCQSRQDAIPNESVCPSQFQGACIYCRHFFSCFDYSFFPNFTSKPGSQAVDRITYGPSNRSKGQLARRWWSRPALAPMRWDRARARVCVEIQECAADASAVRHFSNNGVDRQRRVWNWPPKRSCFNFASVPRSLSIKPLHEFTLSLREIPLFFSFFFVQDVSV